MVSKNTITVVLFLALSCSRIIEGLKCKKEPSTRRYCVVAIYERGYIKAYNKQPNAVDDKTKKCGIHYMFQKDGTFVDYWHTAMDVGQYNDRQSTSVVYVGDDKSQWCWVKEPMPDVHIMRCACDVSLCNEFGSPIHKLMLEMVDNITGRNFPEPYPGYFRPVALTTIPKDADCEDDENAEAIKKSAVSKPFMIISCFVMMIYNIILV